VKRFGYARDPLCLLACTAYALNRWCVPPAWKGVFLHGYFADCLLIPAALPLVLWLQYRLGLRPAADRPRWGEILLHAAVWSVAAEVIMPHLSRTAIADPWDVVAYAAGAVVSGLAWAHA
jgi:hypothetical protein